MHGAKQLSTNIDYMKNSLGSALAPAITYITNLVYNMMKAIQSVIYALFRVNIFAKASASSYASMAGSAKKAKEESKQLVGVHDEINNVQSNDSSDSGSGGSSSPSFDLSGIENQMSPLAQKLYDFFKPLVDSWNKYGPALVEQIKTTAGQVTGLISVVWGSFEKIITNGTVYKSLELILAIIGNIAEAFANAWNYNGNGDAIVQNLVNAFNNLLTAINNVVQSEGFQNWLNNCSDKFRVISEKIASINWQPMVDALLQLGSTIGTFALDVLDGLTNSLKWLVEHPEVSGTILAIVTAYKALAAILAIVNALKASETLAFLSSVAAKLSDATETAILIAMYAAEAVQAGIATAATWLLNAAIAVLTSPITLVVAAIAALIAIIVLCVKHWDEIKETVTNVCNKMKETVSNWVNNVSNFFSNLKTNIINKVTEIKDGIKNKFQEAYNGIKNIFSNIGNFFSGIWNNVKNTFSNLGTSIGNAISGAVKTGINGVISLIEKTINSAIRLINGGIKLINLIPGVSVGTINTLSLPRLAKGGVLTEATTVLAGEYSGAKTNPEIVTPQNIMRDTFEDVLSDFNNGNGQPVHITIQYLGKEIFDDTIDYINSKTRRTGKNTIVTVGG